MGEGSRRTNSYGGKFTRKSKTIIYYLMHLASRDAHPWTDG